MSWKDHQGADKNQRQENQDPFPKEPKPRTS